MHRRSLLLSSLMLPGAVTQARAQTAGGTSTRPITIVVPFPPGGLSDVMTRALGQRLGQELGQTVVVDNRPGAGTSVASAFVLQSRPDGTTLLMGSNSLATNPTALPQLPPRDPERELVPIGLAYMSAFLLVVRDDFPTRDLAGFIAYAKAHPGRVNFASSGVGAVNHLALELLNRSADIALEHIPFRGGAPALIELRAGRVAAFLATPADVATQLQDGSLRALATTMAQRLDQLPDVPAIAELLPGYEAVYWQALFAPAATPEPVVQRLAEALQAVKADMGFRVSLAARGVVLLPGGPQELRDYLRRETVLWGRVIREANITLE